MSCLEDTHHLMIYLVGCGAMGGCHAIQLYRILCLTLPSYFTSFLYRKKPSECPNMPAHGAGAICCAVACLCLGNCRRLWVESARKKPLIDLRCLSVLNLHCNSKTAIAMWRRWRVLRISGISCFEILIGHLWRIPSKCGLHSLILN